VNFAKGDVAMLPMLSRWRRWDWGFEDLRQQPRGIAGASVPRQRHPSPGVAPILVDQVFAKLADTGGG